MKKNHKTILLFLLIIVSINTLYFIFGGKSRLPVEVFYLLAMNAIYFILTPVFWVSYSAFSDDGKRAVLKTYTWLMGGIIFLVTLTLLLVETPIGDWLENVLSNY